MASNTKSSGHGTPHELKEARIRPRWVPTVSYTIQNIFLSMGTVTGAVSSLLFTIAIVLPLACVRATLSRTTTALVPPPASLRRGKVVLIVGASSGIGLEVLKQYCPEPDTTVIAVSDKSDHVRDTLAQLGDTPATLHSEVIDLAGSPIDTAEAVKRLDEKYGPISHLYAIAGITNYLKADNPLNLETFEKMISVNVSGTTALCMAMYTQMKTRQYGKICIVGSTAGIQGPANMIAYASTKSYLNTFSTSLRVLASSSNIDVVTVEPGFIDTRLTKAMRSQGSSTPGFEFEKAETLAYKMKRGVEKGGVGLVTWPMRQSLLFHALKGLNPICDELGRYVSMKMKVSGKKIS
ncbi:hypothetical protein BKA70DRAFT_129853 [Coprinopsis sp. MPI-PUGE-AT-0042]|nr:hypothetical protein BKA70DRAFT_129853 [Coprinopsis sp. MPI-PUGE-AT-0042]